MNITHVKQQLEDPPSNLHLNSIILLALEIMKYTLLQR